MSTEVDQPDQGPTERQQQDWAEHDHHADELTPAELENERNLGEPEPETGERAALVITKPGYSTVRFGPMTPFDADEWASRLTATFHNTNRPEGTTVTAGPFDPAIETYIDPGSVPGTVEDLMPAFRADPGYTDESYPDIYLRLQMRWGQNRAADLWQQACGWASADEAYDEAADSILAAAVAACTLIGTALPTVEQAAIQVHRMRTLGDQWDGIPASVAAYPDDAAEHLYDALRSLRAANLTLRPVAAEG